MIRVLIVDDHEVVRTGLSMLLSRLEGVTCVGEAQDGAQALDAVRETAPDVVLMDLSMPVMDGIAATRSITAAHPDIRIIALTTFADKDHVRGAIDAGAVGYLLKDSDPNTLRDGILAAHRGEAPIDPRAAVALLADRPRNAGISELTGREREVLALIGEGLTNRLIARQLGIAEKTVKTHLTKIFTTIGVSDRTQAALWWQRQKS